jgi:hypothetical protein
MEKCHRFYVRRSPLQRIQSIRTPIDLIIMDPVETAEKPAAFAVHIGIQQNQWQKDLSGIVDQFYQEISHTRQVIPALRKDAVAPLLV